jgi:hypothetical protein
VTESVGLSYVLPIRWQRPDQETFEDLTGYLKALSKRVELVIVDASPDPVFDRHVRAWTGLGKHLRPHPDLDFKMGKVNGAMTGIREANWERVVLADDDVRYDEAALFEVGSALRSAELVWPQNYFSPLPWHARWDTGRTLLNRAVGGDFPGTLGVRRSFLLDIGGYDGDVLFENLQLIRTIGARGGRINRRLDLYVARRPPTTSHFLSQRVRQAYDDFAIPARMLVSLAVLPTLLEAARRKDRRVPALLLSATTLAAEFGRRRAGGSSVFPPSASLWGPAWILERAVCSWLALASRIRHGGIRYGDTVLEDAGARVASGYSHSRAGMSGNPSVFPSPEVEMAKDHGPSVKNDKQYEGLRKKGMSKQRAASIANSPNSSSKGGKKSGKGKGGSKSQKRAAGREGGKKSS